MARAYPDAQQALDVYRRGDGLILVGGGGGGGGGNNHKVA